LPAEWAEWLAEFNGEFPPPPPQALAQTSQDDLSYYTSDGYLITVDDSNWTEEGYIAYTYREFTYNKNG
jgi:hypothetical protein